MKEKKAKFDALGVEEKQRLREESKRSREARKRRRIRAEKAAVIFCYLPFFIRFSCRFFKSAFYFIIIDKFSAI